MPSDLSAGASAELEEERRLLYVAMTRARDELHLMTPQRFFVHGQPKLGDRYVSAQRTRFIPKAPLGLFEKTSWPPAAPAPRPASTSPAGRRCGGDRRVILPLEGEGWVPLRSNGRMG